MKDVTVTMFNMFTKEELLKLQHFVNYVGKRVIPCYFYSQNPKEMIKWQFNCCNQTSIILNYLLKRVNKLEGWTIESYEGLFENTVMGVYNHAWNFCVNTKTNESLLIDAARTSVDCIFKYRVGNYPDMFLSMDKELRDERKLLDFDKLSQMNEFYTGKTMDIIISDINNILIKSNIGIGL